MWLWIAWIGDLFWEFTTKKCVFFRGKGFCSRFDGFWACLRVDHPLSATIRSVTSMIIRSDQDGRRRPLGRAVKTIGNLIDHAKNLTDLTKAIRNLSGRAEDSFWPLLHHSSPEDFSQAGRAGETLFHLVVHRLCTLSLSDVFASSYSIQTSSPPSFPSHPNPSR